MNNVRNTWKGIKNLININSKNNNKRPSSLLINNNLVTDPTQVANRFNKHFTTIANKLQEKIHNSGQDFTKYLQNRNEQSIFIYSTNEN